MERNDMCGKKNVERVRILTELSIPHIHHIMSFLHRSTCAEKGKPKHMQCTLVSLGYPDIIASIIREFLFAFQKEIECNCPGCDKDHPNYPSDRFYHI
jgi:hypothetical protein